MATTILTGYTGQHQHSLSPPRVAAPPLEGRDDFYSSCGQRLIGRTVEERTLHDLTHRHSLCHRCWTTRGIAHLRRRADEDPA